MELLITVEILDLMDKLTIMQVDCIFHMGIAIAFEESLLSLVTLVLPCVNRHFRSRGDVELWIIRLWWIFLVFGVNIE